MAAHFSIEIAYLLTGLILPVFYIPQIVRLLRDSTGIASYSLYKASWQFMLRLPTLVFAVVVVQNGFMIVVLAADLTGRVGEIAAAVHSLRRQAFKWPAILERMHPSWLPGGAHLVQTILIIGNAIRAFLRKGDTRHEGVSASIGATQAAGRHASDWSVTSHSCRVISYDLQSAPPSKKAPGRRRRAKAPCFTLGGYRYVASKSPATTVAAQEFIGAAAPIASELSPICA